MTVWRRCGNLVINYVPRPVNQYFPTTVPELIYYRYPPARSRASLAQATERYIFRTTRVIGRSPLPDVTPGPPEPDCSHQMRERPPNRRHPPPHSWRGRLVPPPAPGKTQHRPRPRTQCHRRLNRPKLPVTMLTHHVVMPNKRCATPTNHQPTTGAAFFSRCLGYHLVLTTSRLRLRESTQIPTTRPKA